MFFKHIPKMVCVSILIEVYTGPPGDLNIAPDYNFAEYPVPCKVAQTAPIAKKDKNYRVDFTRSHFQWNGALFIPRLNPIRHPPFPLEVSVHGLRPPPYPGYHNLSDEATTTPVYGSNSQSEPVFSFHRRKTVFIYCQGGQIKIREFSPF